MEAKNLEKLVNLMSSKFSTTIRINDRKSDIDINFPVPLQLNSDYNYEIGLQWFSAYNTIFNIKDKNEIEVTDLNRNKKIAVLIEPGAYEISQINKRISKFLFEALNIQDDKSPITLSPDIPTSRSILNVSDNYKIEFKTIEVRDLLGFSKSIFQKGIHFSDKIINISDINSINIQCDIIEGSYNNGNQTNNLYSFPIDTVPRGARIIERMYIPIYMPIIKKYIDSIHIRIVDEHDNLIDFHGETIQMSLHIKQV